MKILDEGHHYSLLDNKSTEHNEDLRFFKDDKINGNGYTGTTNQEVLRALIDRVKFLDGQVQNDLNQEIIYHLRKALVLHEMRHLDRLVDKGKEVEFIETVPTHFVEVK